MCAVNNISCFWTPICMFLIHLVGTFPICRSWKNQSIISAAVKNQLLSETKLPRVTCVGSCRCIVPSVFFAASLLGALPAH